MLEDEENTTSLVPVRTRLTAFYKTPWRCFEGQPPCRNQCVWKVEWFHGYYPVGLPQYRCHVHVPRRSWFRRCQLYVMRVLRRHIGMPRGLRRWFVEKYLLTI